jgi:hypothetical protein
MHYDASDQTHEIPKSLFLYIVQEDLTQRRKAANFFLLRLCAFA